MPLVSYDGPYAVDLCLPDSVVTVEPGTTVDVPDDVAAELVARPGDEWSDPKPPAPPALKKPKEA